MRQIETHVNRFRVTFWNGSSVFSITAPLGRVDKAWVELMKVLKAKDRQSLSDGLSRVTHIERLG